MGFSKAKPEQAAVKMSIYGPQGSGKTYSALLFSEGLAKVTGKRVALVDTERGSDFYAMPVKERTSHPEAFDFDAIYTRSLKEVVKELRGIDNKIHGIIVIDSVSHLWDSAMNSYTGKKNAAGAIPMWAWGKIKEPYKEMMKFLVDSPFHVFILGRQANAFVEDANTGEVKGDGYKMRAEGETAYEPHVCIRMAPEKNKKLGTQEPVALVEKDRSGILAYKRIAWPTFDNIIKPLLGIMGQFQGATPDDDSVPGTEQDELALLAHQDEVQHWRQRFDAMRDCDPIEWNMLMPELRKLSDVPLRKEAWGLMREYALRWSNLEFDDKSKQFVAKDNLPEEPEMAATKLGDEIPF